MTRSRKNQLFPADRQPTFSDLLADQGEPRKPTREERQERRRERQRRRLEQFDEQRRFDEEYEHEKERMELSRQLAMLEPRGAESNQKRRRSGYPPGTVPLGTLAGR